MTNVNHLKILKEGVQAWNLWRKDNPAIRPDLSNLELSGADLAGYNLKFAKLNHANLDSADLRNADLTGASLRAISLCSSNLAKAKLAGANIQKAGLIGAQLCTCDFRRADLSRSDFCGADLSGADLRGTYLVGVTLNGAKITGARLYGTSRDDWKIEGVLCDHIFWDQEGRNKTPLHGQFKMREFESIYRDLPGVEDHFDLRINQDPARGTLILGKNSNNSMAVLTTRYLFSALLPYLKAVADLQHLVNDFKGQPGSEVTIVSITQTKHIKVIMTGVSPLLSIIQEKIVPWRRENRKMLARQERNLAQAAIKERESQILDIKSTMENNQIDSKTLKAEAAKKQTEANQLKNNAIPHHRIITQEVETRLVALLPATKLSPKALMEFKQRAAVHIEYLIGSNLAD